MIGNKTRGGGQLYEIKRGLYQLQSLAELIEIQWKNCTSVLNNGESHNGHNTRFTRVS